MEDQDLRGKVMSICRRVKIGQSYGNFNEYRHTAETASDVYMYEHVGGFLACQECGLGGSVDHEPGNTIPFVKLPTWLDAVEHLKKHMAAGHAVPVDAIEACQEMKPSWWVAIAIDSAPGTLEVVDTDGKIVKSFTDATQAFEFAESENHIRKLAHEQDKH